MMGKLFVRFLHPGEIHFARENTICGNDWHEIERQPDFLMETLRYDLETDSVVIEKSVKTPEQIAAEQKAAEDATLLKPDTIRALQGKIAELEGRLTKVEEGKI